MSGNWSVSTLSSSVADIYSDAILLTSNNRRNITWGRGWYQAYPRMQRRNQFSALRGSRLITADKRQTNASTQTKRLGQTKVTTEGVVTWRRFCFFRLVLGLSTNKSTPCATADLINFRLVKQPLKGQYSSYFGCEGFNGCKS
jgi:hypothetical protein